MKQGWIYENFGNCIKLKSGDNLTAKKMVSGSYPVYGGNDIAGYHNEYNLDGDNIIIGRVGAQCGNARYVTDKIWLTDNAFKITDLKYDFDLMFLYYLLNYADLRSYARQAAQPVISNSSLKNVKLKFPKSVKEQQQIVAILDEAFEAIDQAQANIEKNINNAQELFQSKLNDIFSQKGEGWSSERFGNVCKFVRGPFGGSLKKSYFVEDGFAVYEQRHAIYDQFDTIRYFIDDIKFKEMQRFELKSGDLIMSCSGTMGKVAIVPPNIKKGIINQALLKLTPNEIIDVEFLKCWMQSTHFLNEISKHSKGAAIKNVASVKILKEIKVPIASKEKQIEIIELYNEIETNVEALISSYENKLTNLEDLKKSILEKAFAGELTNN